MCECPVKLLPFSTYGSHLDCISFLFLVLLCNVSQYVHDAVCSLEVCMSLSHS